MNFRHPVAARLLAFLMTGSLIALAHRPALAVGGIGDAYISSDASNLLRAYGGVTGAFLGVHAVSTAGATGQLALHFGAANNRLLVGHTSGGVNEFDATTGAYIKTYEPGAGWIWAALYAPNGNVYLSYTAFNQVREYNSATGAFVRVVSTIPGGPADMRIGPDGNLYVVTYYVGGVYEVDPVSGAILGSWSLPPAANGNDVAFLNGQILVTAQGTNVVYRFDSTPAHNLLGLFAGTGWGNPHGIDISPHNGHIYVVDGITTQVHEFDPLTFTELNPAWLLPNPGDKIMDIEFRRDDRVTPVRASTWGSLKALYR